MVNQFRKMDVYEKLKNKKMTKRPLEKTITEIYREFSMLLMKDQKKAAKRESILERVEPP